MKRIIFLCLSLFLVGCNSITGEFMLEKDLVFKRQGFWSTKSLPLHAGSHLGKAFVRRTREQDYLIIDLDDNKYDIKFKLVDQGRFPKNGEVKIPSTTSGQPYDLKMSFETTETIGEVIEDYRDCTYTETDMRCDVYCQRDMLGRGGCQRSCYPVHITRHGVERIKYQVITSDMAVEGELFEDEEVVGTFDGSMIDTKRDYLYRGTCR